MEEVASLISDWANFFKGTYDNHFDRIHSSLTVDHYLGDAYVGKEASGMERTLCRVGYKKLQEIMDWCTGHCDMIEMMWRSELNIINQINSLPHNPDF